MDSEGIWNACTTKVMTKTAITTVASKDCSELTASAGECFSIAPIPGSLGMITATHATVRFPRLRQDIPAPGEQRPAPHFSWWNHPLCLQIPPCRYWAGPVNVLPP